MKQTLKKFSILSLFFFIATFIVGCSEDYEITEHNHSHDRYTIKNYSYKQALKLSKFQKANKIAKQELNLKFSDLKNFKNSKFKRTDARDATLSFAIDSTLIKEVTKNNVTTYTMLIALDTVDYSNNSFDNLIVKIDSLNNTSSYIIHYTPTEEGVYNTTHNSYTFQGDIELSKVYGITTFGGGGSNLGGGDQDYNGGEAGGGNTNTWDSVICVTLIKCNYLYPHIAGPGCANTYSETFCYTNPNYNPWGGSGNTPEDEDPLGGNNYIGNGSGGGSSSSSSNTNNTVETTTTTVTPQEIENIENYYIAQRQKNFTDDLSWSQTAWLNNNQGTENNIYEYLESQVTDPLATEYSNESIVFVENFIQNAIESGLELDFEKSSKSPTNIDFSEIDTTTPEGLKLDCVYQKLMQSPSFKNLVNNTFGVSNKINLKFEIVQNLTHVQPNGTITYPNGTSQLNTNVAFGTTYYNNTIQLSGNNLLSVGANKSNFEIAKTIIHEIIHAYLNIKRKGCSAASIPEVNSHLFPELISSFYTAGCSIDVNNTDQSEHAFMFDYMIPAFQMIFAEIRDLLTSQLSIQNAESSVLIDFNGSTINETFNWNDFYKYFSMNGLNNNNAFNDAIVQNPSELSKYQGYISIGNSFSKNCQ